MVIVWTIPGNSDRVTPVEAAGYPPVSSACFVRPTLAMQRIFSSPRLIEVTQLKDALEGVGIACFIRNEVSSGLVGEIPLTEGTPELWIQDDNDMIEAIRV